MGWDDGKRGEERKVNVNIIEYRFRFVAALFGAHTNAYGSDQCHHLKFHLLNAHC